MMERKPNGKPVVNGKWKRSKEKKYTRKGWLNEDREVWSDFDPPLPLPLKGREHQSVRLRGADDTRFDIPIICAEVQGQAVILLRMIKPMRALFMNRGKSDKRKRQKEMKDKSAVSVGSNVEKVSWASLAVQGLDIN